LLNDLGVPPEEYKAWPDEVVAVVAEAWERLRKEKLATFQEHASRPRHAEQIESALQARHWFRAHLPAHRRELGKVDLSLPVEENPLYPHMRQVRQASQQALDAFAEKGAACVCFLGGSGVGKTTAAFDLLSKEWGFYISAVQHDAMRYTPEYGPPAAFLQRVASHGSDADVIAAVLCDVTARMLVLYLLHCKGLVKTPLDWLLAQLDGAAALILGTML
jgi:hypothetical protein